MKDVKDGEMKTPSEVENLQVMAPALQKRFSSGALIAVAVATAAVTSVLGFVGGAQYQKSSVGSNNLNQPAGFGMNGRGGVGMNRGGTFGEVTAISDSSITISVMRGGPNSSNSSSSTKTYTINSSTTITVDGSTGSVSDIKTGDTVMISPSSSDSSVAISIRVGMGGAPGAQTQSADTTSSET